MNKKIKFGALLCSGCIATVLAGCTPQEAAKPTTTPSTTVETPKVSKPEPVPAPVFEAPQEPEPAPAPAPVVEDIPETDSAPAAATTATNSAKADTEGSRMKVAVQYILDSSDFASDDWSKGGEVAIEADAGTAPEGGGSAQKITMATDAVLFKGTGEVVRVGEILVAGAWLWADAPATVSLEIGRQGGTAEYEGMNTVVELTETPQYFEVQNKFFMPHPTARMLLRNRSGEDVAFYAWGAKVTKKTDTQYIVNGSDFAASEWSSVGDVAIEADAVAAPEGEGKAQKITLQPGASLFQGTERLIRGGDTLEAEAWLWADASTEVSIEIGRHGGTTEFEGKARVVELTDTPQYFRVNSNFAITHPSARLLLRNRTDAEISFYAWNAGINKK